MDPDLCLPGGDTEREALDALGAQWVWRLAAELSADQRTVLLLRVVADLTAEEVARVIGKTEGAVRGLQRRGLDSLRRLIADQACPTGLPRRGGD